MVRERTYTARDAPYCLSVHSWSLSMTDFTTRSLVLRLTVVCLGCLAAVSGVSAAEPGAVSGARAQYRKDLAVCNSGRSHQPAATCRIEARQALAEARRGGLVDTPDIYAANARQRCLALEGIERAACDGRMRGEGKTEGSVNAGGILRESTTAVPAN